MTPQNILSQGLKLFCVFLFFFLFTVLIRDLLFEKPQIESPKGDQVVISLVQDGGVAYSAVLDAELEDCEEENSGLPSWVDMGIVDADVDSGEDMLTRQTSGYCGCEPSCCGEFAYDPYSGCDLCEVLSD